MATVQLSPPTAPFQKIKNPGESITINTAGKVLVLPTGNALTLPSFNEYVLNSNRLTIAESPFGGMSNEVYQAIAPATGSLLYASPANSANGGLEYLNFGESSRISKTGYIRKIKFALANTATAGITKYYLKIWRYESNTYTVVGITENLASVIVTGINEVTLNTPVFAKAGDYYGVYCLASTTTSIIQTELISGGTLKYIKPSAGYDLDASFDWATPTGTAAGKQLTVYSYIDSKDLLPGCLEITEGLDSTVYLENAAETYKNDFLNSGRLFKNTECSLRNPISINPSTALAPTAPYSGTMPYVSPGNKGSMDIINMGHTARIRQSGYIKKVKFGIANASPVTTLKIKIWRNTGSTYEVVSESENLVGMLTDGINEITLDTPILAAEGDYYGVYFNSTGTGYIWQTELVTGGTIKYTAVDNTSYSWDTSGSSIAGKQYTVYLYMDSPDIAFIGDSTTAGSPANGTFLQTSNTNVDLTSTTSYNCCHGQGLTYQNMGIGSQKCSQIRARFEADIIALHPRIAVIETGLNEGEDILLPATQQGIIDDIEEMIQLCIANNIIPVLFEVPPATTDTVEKSLARTAVTAGIYALQSTYSFYIFSNRNAVGTQDPATGKWSIIPAYDCGDNLHYSIAGYTELGQELNCFITNWIESLQTINIKNESATEETVTLELRTIGNDDIVKFFKYQNNEYVIDSSIVYTDTTFSLGTTTGKSFEVAVPATTTQNIKIEIYHSGNIESDYKYSNDLEVNTGLQNLVKPFIALYDPAGNYIDFFLFTHRPKSLVRKRDDTGNIYEMVLYPGNGSIYRGRITNALLTVDTDSNLIPDCLESSVEGSVTKFLSSYGMVI